MKKKRYVSIFITIGVLLLFLPVVLGGFWNWFNSISGLAAFDDTNLTINVGNNAPYILAINMTNSSMIIDPVEGSSINVQFWVWVNDSDGVSNLDVAPAGVTLNVSNSAEPNYLISNTPRVDNSCTLTGDSYNGFERNFTCSITFWYFDPPSTTWNVTAQVTDVNGATSNLTKGNFQITTTQGIVLSPKNLSWSNIALTSYNITPTENITINNTGNWNISFFNVTAYDLVQVGGSDPPKFIGAENFSMSAINLSIACIRDGKQSNRTINDTEIHLANASLVRGNFSQGGGVAQEELYICYRDVDDTLVAGAYATKKAWRIDGHQ